MRKLAYGVSALGVLVLASLALCGGCDSVLAPKLVRWDEGEAPQQRTYRVAVLGDSQKGLANFSNLVRAVSAEAPAFLLHTGDIVSNNDDGHYRLVDVWLQRAGERVRPAAVPGNHDVKGGTARFEARYGPLERSFKAGQVAFVLLNNAFGEPPIPKHVEERIRAAGPADAVVLATHIPPFDLKGGVNPGYEPFLAWLERNPRVKYLLCGHVHDYVKRKVGETTVLINGVGGDFESWQLKQKVYATILEVDGAAVTDRTIELAPEHGVFENLEHLAVGHVAEAFRQKPFLAWPGTALLAALTGFSFGYARLRKPA